MKKIQDCNFTNWSRNCSNKWRHHGYSVPNFSSVDSEFLMLNEDQEIYSQHVRTYILFRIFSSVSIIIYFSTVLKLLMQEIVRFLINTFFSFLWQSLKLIDQVWIHMWWGIAHTRTRDSGEPRTYPKSVSASRIFTRWPFFSNLLFGTCFYATKIIFATAGFC